MVPFPHAADTQIGPLEGKRADVYEQLTVRRGDIRVMGVLTHPPLCRRMQEKCCETTAGGESGRNIIILYLRVASTRSAAAIAAAPQTSALPLK